MHYLIYIFCMFCIYFLALITAARESSAAKINQLLSALESIGYKTELLTEKQALCERQNAELWYVFI